MLTCWSMILMPRKDIHDAFEQAIFGYVSGMTDLMDAPFALNKWGGHHRKFGHSIRDIVLLATVIHNDLTPLQNLGAGLLHKFLDETLTESKNQLRNISKNRNSIKRELKRRHPNTFKHLLVDDDDR